MPQSDASSPKSGAPIGPWPPHGPAATVGNGLIVHPARDRGAVKLSLSEPRDMNRLAPKSRAVLRRLAEGRVGPACLLGHPGALRLALINVFASSGRHAVLVIQAGQHASAWWRLHRGGGAGGCLLSAGDIGGHGGMRKSTVRRCCEPERRSKQRGALFVPRTVRWI